MSTRRAIFTTLLDVLLFYIGLFWLGKWVGASASVVFACSCIGTIAITVTAASRHYRKKE